MVYEYPDEVVLARAAQDRLAAGRIRHVRAICENAIERDKDPNDPSRPVQTDRKWLAQSVLNILDGLIDPQIIEEQR